MGRNVFFVNAQETVNVVIKQNYRWDNAVIGLKPNYVYPDQLSFEYEEKKRSLTVETNSGILI